MFLWVLVVVFFAGCTGTAGVKVRGYVEDKKRVDQDLSTGNAGYLMGAPDEIEDDRKETRKIYVLEMTKELEETPEEEVYTPSSKAVVPTYTKKVKTKKTIVVAPEPEFVIPSFDDEEIIIKEERVQKKKAVSTQTESVIVDDDASGPKTYAVYTVEKNDTLQKISKKFYDSYSKWPKIYEANRLKIKNPDALIPGTVLKVPVE